MPRVTGDMSTSRIWRCAGVVAMLFVLLGRGPAAAQNFGRPADADVRLEWSGGEDRRGRPVVSGYIYNQRAGSYATSVRLLVEALDASGQVVGSTTAYVLGEVPPSSRSFFEVKSPAEGASYRVTVQSLAWRAYGAGGGM